MGGSGSKPRLLIVDDEPDMLDFFERVFRAGYEVVRAGGAEEALALLRAGRFDVLVTDQKMPQMTGLELLGQIAAGAAGAHEAMARVLVSGFTDVPDIEQALARSGLDNYVLKPVDSARLREAVEQALATRGRRNG